MEQRLFEYKGKQCRLIENTTLIGDWDDVRDLELSTITHNANDTDKLDGLIIKGYETKFADGTNENGERYSKDALDKFVQKYYVGKGFNLCADVEHDPRPEWLVGRAIYLEVNTTGYYFVVYIPRTEEKYNTILGKLKNGLLQGFSKFGFATEWESKFDTKGNWLYDEIKDFELLRISIVSTPANGVSFEKVAEIKNGLRYVKKESDWLAEILK